MIKTRNKFLQDNEFYLAFEEKQNEIVDRHKIELDNFRKYESDILKSVILTYCEDIAEPVTALAENVLHAGLCVFNNPVNDLSDIKSAKEVIFRKDGIFFIARNDKDKQEVPLMETKAGVGNLCCILKYVKMVIKSQNMAV